MIGLLVVLGFVLSSCQFYRSHSVVLAVEVEGMGEVMLDGVTDGELKVEEGTIVELKAEAKEGWKFSHWQGNVKDKYSSQTSILMDKDQSIKAIFEEKEKPQPSYFEVTILGSNSPVYQGEEMKVDVEIRNSGEQKDSQEIKLLVSNNQKDYQTIALEPDEKKVISLYWETALEDKGQYEALVKSDNSTDTINLEVKEKEAEDVKISFNYRHLEGAEYEFTAEYPESGKFFHWKFPGESFWFSYERDYVEYEFKEEYRGQSVEVKLKVFDEDGDQIGETYTGTVQVKEAEVTYHTLNISTEGEGVVSAGH